MIVLGFLFIAMLAISCGGSKGSGGNGGSEDICFYGDKCANNPYAIKKPNGAKRLISFERAKELIEASENKLRDLKLGQTFTEIQDCEVGEEIFGKIVLEKVLIEYNANTGEMRHKVNVQRNDVSDSYSCAFLPTNHKEYIEISTLPNLSSELEDLEKLEDIYLTTLDGKKFIVAYGEITEDSITTNIEIGINLEEQYTIGFYLDQKLKYGSRNIGYVKEYTVFHRMQDIVTIDVTDLPEVRVWSK